MITRKAGPALVSGCRFVCRPSEKTALSALALAVLAGVPDGVFAIIPGLNASGLGMALCSNRKVRKLTFYRGDPRGQHPDAAMRRSSCSMMPIWTRRWKAR